MNQTDLKPVNSSIQNNNQQVVPIQPVTEVIKILQSANTTKPEAKLNETSISDGKGGRIELNNDKNVSNDFEK